MLDVAELLPLLMLEQGDRAAEFRQQREGLLSIEALFGLALHRFDEAVPPR